MKKLGFGTMRLPVLNKEDPTSIDIEQYKQMVDEYLANGFIHFDTAYMYHNCKSENALKTALVDRYPRESYTVTSKLPPNEIKSFEDRDKIFNEQLEKTGLKYFDYYWIHCVMANNYEPTFEKYDCFGWLEKKKELGLVKHTGFSFHDNAELLDKILTKHPEVEFVQLQLNYLDWDSYDVQSRKCYEVCVKHGKKVFVMEPVKGGALVNVSDAVKEHFKKADKDLSLASWAIRFAASLDNVYMVLSGMSDLSQLRDNMSYMKDFKPLTEGEVKLCLEAAEIINSERAIKCTGCSYCTKGCPKEIKIPEYFNMYNRKKQTTSAGTLGRMQEAYVEFVSKNPAPTDCIECGQCEDSCPQHLPIRQYLKDVAEEFK